MDATMKGRFIEIDSKSKKITEKDEALIKIIPIGSALKFRMSRRSTFQLKQDVWDTARRNGWLSS